MKKGSHNSFTYLPIKQWWLKPFRFMARCQEVDISRQYALGIRLFDIRIRFDKNTKEPYICHGIFKFKHDKDFISNTMKILNKCKGIYVRVLLETPKYEDWQVYMFKAYCKWLEDTYSNIKFFGGNTRNNSTPLYTFNTKNQSLDGKYSSQANKRYILWPRGYARKYNSEILKNGTNKTWLFYDFVNLQ